MEHDVSTYVKNHSNKYLVVNSLSRRVRDLQSGYKALVNPAGRDLMDIATDEFLQEKISVSTLQDE